METIKTLDEFIAAAEKGRKYPGNTAGAFRTALKLFEKEMNEGEKSSLDTFEANLNKIYNEVVNKNKTKMSVTSLATYRHRIVSLLRDYREYGITPSKMVSWERKPRIRNHAQMSNRGSDNYPSTDTQPNFSTGGTVGEVVNRLEIPLSDNNNRKALLVVPRDLTKEDVARLTSILGVLPINK